MTNKEKVVFIGGGNMASSIIAGMLASGWAKGSIAVSDPDELTLKKIVNYHDISSVFTDNSEAIDFSEIVVLAVKPQLSKKALESFQPALKKRKKHVLLISIVAGLNINSIEEWTANTCTVVRCMPNIPARIQQGVTALCTSKETTQEYRDLSEAILSTVGKTIWVNNEGMIDVVTAISGSGPAYYFYFFDAMEQAAVELGLSKDDAKKLVRQTAYGSLKLAEASSEELTQLIEQVSSKGGTTEKALEVFDRKDFKHIIKQAIKAAQKRSVEISKETGNS